MKSYQQSSFKKLPDLEYLGRFCIAGLVIWPREMLCSIPIINTINELLLRAKIAQKYVYLTYHIWTDKLNWYKTTRFGVFFSPGNYHAYELCFSNSLIPADLPQVFWRLTSISDSVLIKKLINFNKSSNFSIKQTKHNKKNLPVALVRKKNLKCSFKKLQKMTLRFIFSMIKIIQLQIEICHFIL